MHSPYWIALSAESTVAADQVIAGSAGLGKLDPLSVGSFYAAFFALSIGYERMAKIAIQVDSRLTTGAYKSSKEMRSIGHDLGALFDHVESISVRRGYDKVSRGSRPTDPIHIAILDLLTGFATRGRYDHLDSLGGPGWNADTAENQWDQHVMRQLMDRHLSSRIQRSIDSDVAANELMVLEATTSGMASSFIHQDVDGTSHTGVGGITRRALQYEKMNSWGRMYALHLGRWLAHVLCELGRDAHATDDVPYLVEFFGFLLGDDEILRTRRDLRR